MPMLKRARFGDIMRLSVLIAGICVALLSAGAGNAAERGSSIAAFPASAHALGEIFKDQYAQIGDVRLHYVVGGKGPPVLLVPGWPETWWAWRNVMPSLAATHTVIAVDTRGMGESSRPNVGYDM